MDLNNFFDSMLENLSEPVFTDFEQCNTITNEGLKNYLSEVIPIEHIEQCPLIDYEPNDSLFRGNNDILAYYDMTTSEIKISDSNRFESDDMFLDSIVHEIGHNEYNNSFSEESENVQAWVEIHSQSLESYINNGIGCVSDYAATDAEEDFCESYSAYIRDPELLKFHSPEKYEFMKDKVFEGREYQETIYVGNDTFVTTPTTLQAVMYPGYNISMEDFLKITKGGDMDNIKNTIRCFDKIASS